jgi:hypothetical protein
MYLVSWLVPEKALETYVFHWTLSCLLEHCDFLWLFLTALYTASMVHDREYVFFHLEKFY